MARLIAADSGVAMTADGLPGLSAGTLVSQTESTLIASNNGLFYKLDIVNLADPLVTSITVDQAADFLTPDLIVLNLGLTLSALNAAPNMMPLILSGADSLLAGTANDALYAFDGADSADGGTGDDRIYGNGGADVVQGGVGNDAVFGGRDNDIVRGGNGSDAVYGNLGDDIVYGNADGDSAYGGQGNDALYGGSGHDFLFGNKGDDILWVGPGFDQATGGLGADTFGFSANGGEDLIFDFDDTEGDRLLLKGVTVASLQVEGENTLVNLSDGGFIRIIGIAPDALAAATITL